ncbi:alpha/beta hydrolase [Arthrobacter sp. AL08]|uniref:alpha/beta fold hydrolase n=1 Tax=Micrococcaceae TaxID=1268 RepID=UPI001CFFA364|nr:MULTISPECIES: alpha/beta hydrolase [Micrococcaceae]MCB5282819.1 2-hydroxy-6-oxononadienedioate/2-hydroxy-6-oxononatrienedioate hydrolase [Arthrobacter sp. ES1]MDI3240199.1 alpha/beta hydrolase [Arthrobacter sp. AL05]MDI3276209.1 alpha/beta hydrolase [Arthrobacter sp. AL08]MDJ0353786.1 alpha/beta hydrolase [Pseudarthrobacter sp. PH31-O2]WGZ78997.1 alpha/beta hydrolase [Arthrobacter sp. EM1]
MSVQQETAPSGAATLRRSILGTELGPCTVRVQHGTDGLRPATGTPDVYLHGAAGSWTTFLPLLSRAPAHDRVLIDLPGWGDSTSGCRPERFSIEAMARAVTEVLDSLGYQRWNLVGHSMGGFLALHVAATSPERTASVATISATTFGVAGAARRPLRSLFRFPAFVGMLTVMRAMAALGPAGSALIRAVGTTPVMRPLLAPFFADPAAISPQVIRGLGLDARPASFLAAARAAARYDFSQWRGISCPVLALRGDRDVFTPASDLIRLAAVIPHIQPATVPDCGHFANIERPEYVQALLDDLRRP